MDLTELLDRKRQLDKLLDRYEQLTSGGAQDPRAADAQRKREARSRYINIASRKSKDSERRAACEADIVLALQTYFPADFFQEFTPLRREIAEVLMRAASHGGD
jgi:hypothetical protein